MKISVVVKPNSRKEKVEKSENCYIVSVREPPFENKANLAVIKLLSDFFDVPKSQILIVSGQKSKRKIINVKD